ncbi:hypothetical protein BURK_004302 [Burkholderia sp. SJ98]|nr:hypothetical protein BURK_004302 [Burkholderia sp. SJ98]
MSQGQLYKLRLERESYMVVGRVVVQDLCHLRAGRTSSIALIVELMRADLLQHGSTNSCAADESRLLLGNLLRMFVCGR